MDQETKEILSKIEQHLQILVNFNLIAVARERHEGAARAGFIKNKKREEYIKGILTEVHKDYGSNKG